MNLDRWTVFRVKVSACIAVNYVNWRHGESMKAIRVTFGLSRVLSFDSLESMLTSPSPCPNMSTIFFMKESVTFVLSSAMLGSPLSTLTVVEPRWLARNPCLRTLLFQWKISTCLLSCVLLSSVLLIAIYWVVGATSSTLSSHCPDPSSI